MTRLEMTTAACARLQHWWELHGAAANPEFAIHRIAKELAPGSNPRQLEEDLLAHWGLLVTSTTDTLDG